jgi:endonuclease/exonuclease/phosphatase family metal-dependent hydrolase
MYQVLTWNILADEFVHEQDYLHFDFDQIKNRNQRIETITNYLLQQDLNIILLQEVMINEMHYLHDKMFETFYFSHLYSNQWDDYPNSESGNLVLFSKKHFTDLFYTEPLMYKEKVFGVHVLLYEKKTNQRLHIFNIHLNDQYFLIRKAQLKSIQNKLQNYNRVILGGDFNQNYWSNNKTLYKMNDNYIVLNTMYKTYYVNKANINIDNILVKGFQNNDNENNDNKNNNNDNENNDNNDFLMKLYGSDHLPVHGKII